MEWDIYQNVQLNTYTKQVICENLQAEAYTK